PTDIRIALLGDGSLELRWRTRQPAPGAEVYTQIRRQLDGAGPFIPLGATGARPPRYIDTTVPAGTRSIAYLLTTRRGAQSSDPVIQGILLGRPAPAGARGQVALLEHARAA